jgi:gamma-glutamyltranspeptidase/glutathione hydrolase
VAVAAALNVTEPTSTGIGGDLFCLFYSAETKTVRGINASGRSPAGLTLERARKDLGLKGTGEDVDELIQEKIPMSHAHGVTVPGTAAGWVDVVEQFGSGKMDMNQVLGEAIRLAEEGFPVSEVSAQAWGDCVGHLVKSSPNWTEMLKNGERAPREGEIMTMKKLAKVFRKLVNEGKKGFYEGEVAEAIVEAVKERGGVLALDDLKYHLEVGSEVTEPISLEFEGQRVWECAPNGQGIVALMALGILESLEKSGKIKSLGGTEKGWGHNEVEYVRPYPVTIARTTG